MEKNVIGIKIEGKQLKRELVYWKPDLKTFLQIQHETRNGEHPGDKRSTSEDEPPWLCSWIQVLPPRQYEGAVGSLSAHKSFLPSSFPGPLLTGTVTLQLFTSSRCLRIAQNHL